MTQLTVIADDFTGALDTGVQFANKKITVKVMTDEQYATRQDDINCDVVVIDAETRHMSPQAAYQKTLDLARRVKANGTATLYIKTDSGLRGNIGAMLCAAIHGFAVHFAAFVPAFPDMNRITVGGVQYIDGVPIDESVFGEDPFEPVKARYVRELFDGWDLNIFEYEHDADYNAQESGVDRATVGIYDAQTSTDFARILAHLTQKGRLQVLSGCAGLAAALVPILGLEGEKYARPTLDKSLMVLCGSLNPITRKQIEFAQQAGFSRFCLTAHQKHSEHYFSTKDGVAWLRQVQAQMHAGNCILIDTLADTGDLTIQSSVQALQQTEEDPARAQVAARLGRLLKQLLRCEHAENYLVMIIGGDTLMGFMAQLPHAQIMPVCEVAPGAVLFSLTGFHAKTQFLISKSGGFGAEDLLVQIEAAFCGGKK